MRQLALTDIFPQPPTSQPVQVPDRKHLFHESQETSRTVYLDLKYTGKLGKMQQAVFDAFQQFGDHTNLEINLLTKIPINNVTARTNELVNKLGLIIQKGVKVAHTSKVSIVWGVKTSPNEKYVPKYFSRSDLLRRGWTAGAIKRYLPYYDEDTDNPHGFAAPMKLFLISRVEAVEGCPEFRRYIGRRKRVGK